MVWKENEQKRTQPNRTEPKKIKKEHGSWALLMRSLSLVFCIHIEFKSSHRDNKHTHIKNIQIQILYKFEIQFNYWLNFQTRQQRERNVYVCVCVHRHRLYDFPKMVHNRELEFLLNRLDSCVFVCIPNQSRKIFFTVLQQQRTNDSNDSNERAYERITSNKRMNEWTNE